MSLRPMDSEFKRRMTPSIALLVLAALTPAEHDLEIIDENLNQLRSFDKCDLVGITCNVDTFARAKELSAAFRQRGCPVIFGGILPSSAPALASPHADAICIGPAEQVWPRILSDAKEAKLKHTYECPAPHSIARIPRPKWESIDVDKYLYTNVVSTSRGCPFACDFCYNSCSYMRHGYFRRPLQQVLDEIDHLDTKQVLFVDDNFIGDKAWVWQFLGAIKTRELTWHAAVSANIGNDLELFQAMAEAGCRSLYIGFESINARSLSNVNKGQNNVSAYNRTIKAIHDNGIMINASLAFGFDYDYPEVFANTLSWLIENRIETMTSHILTPYPGTRLYARLAAEKRITDYDLSHYNTANVVFAPKHMSAEELHLGYLQMYREFYSSRNIWKRRPLAREQWMPYFLINFGYRKFGGLTSRMRYRGNLNFLGKLARRLAYGIG
jgi:radical SAM superfamily enzyme YgiQ (UPF0313 family)